MKVFFSGYTPIFSQADASDDAPVLPIEPVLFNTDSAGASGGGGKREVKSEEEGLPGKAPSSAQTDQSPENAGEQPDLPADESGDNPGLQAKNKNYFKSDITPDTGIGNV
jgi:hypothetical protein